MAEDRFANVYSVEVTQSGANALTFAELNFGIGLRDKLAIALDQLFFMNLVASLLLMTTAGDEISIGLTNSDAVTNLNDYGDRRNIYTKNLQRIDFGTAASAQFIESPMVAEFAPPVIMLPTRAFIGIDSVGLASAITQRVRIHYRTVPLTTEQQLTEVLEAFQLAT